MFPLTAPGGKPGGLPEQQPHKVSFVSQSAQRILALAHQVALGGQEEAAWPPQPGHALTQHTDLRAAPNCPEALSCCQSPKPASPLSSAF